MHTFRLTKRKAAVSIMGAGGVAEEGQEWREGGIENHPLRVGSI